MTNNLKKSGQKITKRLTRFSRRAEASSRERIENNLVRRASHVADAKIFIIEWLLIVTAVILLAITQANWYSDSYSSSSFVRGGTFTEGTLGKVSSLNPLFASTNSEKTLSRLLFSSLTEDDYSGHIGLALAKSISVDDSGKVWTVTLKDNLKWSDGTPLTIDDVIFTANLIKDPSVSTVYSSNLSGVNVEKSNDNTAVFTLPSPYADFKVALNFPILPEHILKDTPPVSLLDSDFSKNPVSSGPFTFNASQTVGTSDEVNIYLLANENYFKGRVMLDSFTVRAYLNKDSIISALNSGTITATAELTSLDSSKITSGSIYRRDTAINSGVFAFLNTSSAALKEKSVRNSIRKGVSVENIREVASGTHPLDYPILSSQISLETWPTIPAFDKEASISELSQKENKTINLVTVNSGNLPIIAESFADELKTLGFTVNLTTHDPTQDFITNIIRNRAYDILIYEIELGPDPDLLAYYHSSQATSAGLNLSNFRNTLVDDLILASRTTIDSATRTTKYETFLKFWIDETPSIALFQSNLSYYYNKNTNIFSENTKLVYPTDRFVDISTWASEKAQKNRTP